MEIDNPSRSLLSTDPLLVFTLETQCYALRTAAIERVVHMVEITPVPQAPDIVLGVISVQGQIIPVLNPRKRFRLPEHNIGLRNQLIIAHTGRRPVALVVDAVTDVVEYAATAVTAAETLLPGFAYVQGVAQLADGLVLIHDLDTFLSLQEERALDEAMLYTGSTLQQAQGEDE
jgi:purine-binding chemotaxis protein CheW